MPYIVLGSSFHLCLVRGHLLVIPSRNKIGGLSGSVFFVVSCPGVFFFVSCPQVFFLFPVRESFFFVSCPGVFFFVSCPGEFFLLLFRVWEFLFLSGKPFFSRPHQTVVIALT